MGSECYDGDQWILYGTSDQKVIALPICRTEVYQVARRDLRGYWRCRYGYLLTSFLVQIILACLRGAQHSKCYVV